MDKNLFRSAVKLTARRVSLASATVLLASFLVFAPAPAALSSPGWSAPYNLSPDPLTENQSLNMAVGATGQPHAVWAAKDGGSVFRIWYSTLKGSGWTAPENISPGNITGNFEAFVALDADGRPHVAWAGIDAGLVQRVYYTANTGSGWSAPLNISPDPLTNNSRPEIALDAGGHPHVIWQGSGTDGILRIRYSGNTGSGWSAPENLSPGSTSNEIPHLALDNDGDPHVVWHGDDVSTEQIWYTTNAGTWSAPVNLSSGISTDNWSAGMALDGNGEPHVVWKGMDGASEKVFYRGHTGSGWSAPENPSAGIDKSSNPCIALDSGGQPHVAWTGVDDSPAHEYRIWYSNKAGGTWTAPVNRSPATTGNWDSDLEVGPGDVLNLAWYGNDGATDRIWYSENAGSGWSSPVNISPGSAPTDNCCPLMELDGNGDPHVVWEGQDTGSAYRVWYAADIAYRFYFAEGYTGEGFHEYLCLGNPGGTEVNVNVTYLFPDGSTQAEAYAVPARSRFTADVNAEVGGGRDVSIKCEAASPFVAERPMYFDYGGWTGGHDAVGASTPSLNRYFAEGYTGDGFDEYICVLNPGDAAAGLTFRFQTQEAGEQVRTGYSVGPHTRATFKVNDVLGPGYQTSLKLESTQPVVAERPMYFDYNSVWTGGHCVMGAPALSSEYYFAEGTTRSNFHQYLTLQNPGAAPITVDAVYQLGAGQGANVEKQYTIGAGERATVRVWEAVGEEKDVSVKLTSTSDFLAERPIYFDYDYAWTGGHCVIGATSPGLEWFFAEGYTGAGFDEWLCLQNPGASEATVEITYLTQEAGPLTARTVKVPAGTRQTVNVNDDAGPGYQLSVELEVTSGPGIVAERPMYFDFNGWTGGHDVVGYQP